MSFVPKIILLFRVTSHRISSKDSHCPAQHFPKHETHAQNCWAADQLQAHLWNWHGPRLRKYNGKVIHMEPKHTFTPCTCWLSEKTLPTFPLYHRKTLCLLGTAQIPIQSSSTVSSSKVCSDWPCRFYTTPRIPPLCTYIYYYGQLPAQQTHKEKSPCKGSRLKTDTTIARQQAEQSHELATWLMENVVLVLPPSKNP